MSIRNSRRSLVRSSTASNLSVGLSVGLSVSLSFGIALAPCVPVLAATHAMGTSAEASGPEGDPEALSAEAVERFEAKDYDTAVSLFEQAYALDPQPNYLFNIGRVYEEKGDIENAITFYQKFVGQSGVDLESRQAATERLKVLREVLAQMKADEQPDPKDDVEPEPETDPKDEAIDPVPEEQDPEPVVDEEAEQAAKRKKTMRLAGYGLMGAGGAALIVGGIFGGLASGSADDGHADEFVDRRQAFLERAAKQARVADAMFITGGVLAVAGVALVLATLGKGKASASADVASRRTVWSPVVGPQRVGLGMTRRF